MNELKWLHLSDWHHKPIDESKDRRLILNNLLKDIRSRKNIDASLEKLDFVAFSGDIAFQGLETEYIEAAKVLIEPIRDLVGRDVPIIYCPGNHDVSRSHIDEIPSEWSEIVASGKKGDHVDTLLSDRSVSAKFLRPFKNYMDFCKSQGQIYDEGKFYYVKK